MPTYALHCENASCLHKWETFAHARERDGLTCPKCGAKAETDFSASVPKTVHTWEGQEAKSMALAFDPAGIAELKKECPSIELGRDGHVRFRSDSHQRRVYREIQAARERAENELREEFSRAPRASDVKNAAAAIARFETEKAQ